VSFDAIVIGAGFAGLYAVHRCVSEGLTVTGIEAAPSVGGTWYWNRYPGARCDVESVDYSYSFDEGLQNDWTWSERFAAQPEILAYLDHVADRLDLRRHYRFSAGVVRARFDAGEWVVDTSAGDSFRGGGLLHRGVAARGPGSARQEDRRDRYGVVGHRGGYLPRVTHTF
jgi:cation diffusion facilitator CzcD-associated flavoprotein CzcO